MESPAVVVGRVVELHDGPAGLLGSVSVRGALLDVAFDVLREAKVGDSVLVSAGVALARVRGEGVEPGDDRTQEG